MTFLNPILLWGLPLVLLPVIIHLINRMRHRTQQWAAMRFLVAASRSSMGHAKLRQFLILLFRVLAVLMLILFLARPLAGGWLGWALSPAPDAIIMLFDRSASMESLVPGSTLTRRQQALSLLSSASKEFEEASHLILIDSALRTPQEISRAASLVDLSAVGPSDTAADIPSMFQAAIHWLIENHAGTTEIWVASDLQRSNWKPDDPRWNNLVAQIGSLPQKVRLRLLSFAPQAQNNTSVSLKEVARRSTSQESQLHFIVDLARNNPSTDPVPLTMNLDGGRSQIELAMDGQAMRWRHKVDLQQKEAGGWGSFDLPPDANGRDNTTYFVYGSEAPLRASVLASHPQSGRFLRLAAASLVKGQVAPAQVIPATQTPELSLEARTLLVWQSALPVGALAERIRGFAEEGGAVIFFPPGDPGPEQFNGVGWAEIQSAPSSFRVLRWEENEGPLAKTDEGLSLPLGQAEFKRRQVLVGQKTVLAAFEDGTPFLARQTVGRGEIYFCTSLPEPEWSTLGEGPVLVPVIQRLLQSGSKRVQQAVAAVCGELSMADQARQWTAVDTTGSKDIRVQAGVYRSGERLIAVNRPAVEDELEVLPAEEAQHLFGRLPFQIFADKQNQSDRLEGEIWRMFLFTMLFLMLAEGFLTLPARSSEQTPAAAAVRPHEIRNPTAELAK